MKGKYEEEKGEERKDAIITKMNDEVEKENDDGGGEEVPIEEVRG